LVLSNGEPHTIDQRSAMLINPSRVLDGYITVSETSTARMQPIQGLSLNAAVNLFPEFF
jgi:hypothetical protein